MNFSRGIGLTGGIACGKSTVAALLLSAGYPVFDADQLVRELSSTEGILQNLKERYGPLVFDEKYNLDRQRLREIAFNDPNELSFLEELYRERSYQLLCDKASTLPEDQWWFYEAAILFKSDLYKSFYQNWAVVCNESTQRKRLLARDGISEELAQKMLDSQVSFEEMISKADLVISTDGPVDNIHQQLHLYLETLK